MENTVNKVLQIAEAEVGYLEKSKSAYLKNPNVLYSKTDGAGTDNYTKYNYEMHKIYPQVMDGLGAAWCDCFVDWCFYKAYGVATAKSLLGGNFDDYTVASAQMYKNKKAWYTSNPKVGDQVFFKNNTRICHTGLVYKVDSSYVYTIEGNTSNASGVVANGGGVAKKKYALNYAKIAGYGRPKYDPEPVSVKPSTPSTPSTPSKPVSASLKPKSAKSKDSKLAGTYKTTTDLNMRIDAGVESKNTVICTIPKGESVKNYGFYTLYKGVKWLYVDYKGTTGFCSIKCLNKTSNK